MAFLFFEEIRNGYLRFAFISSAISCSINPLIWSDIDSPVSLDFLFKKENVVSFRRTLRLFGFGSDVVLIDTPYWLLWDGINLRRRRSVPRGAI